MPVAGLVLTLVQDQALQESAVQTLKDLDAVTVGELCGVRLPVVTESTTVESQLELWNSLTTIPGVLMVDLAFQDFSDVDYIDSKLLVRKRAQEHES